MANWAKLQEQLTGLPVVKRDKHSIHFAKGDGQIVANFSGAPCHYEENGIWKALDTAIKELPDGSLGAKGVPVRLNLNGLVRLINENNEDLYSQVTTRVGVFNSNTMNLIDYINLPVGKVVDDQLVKETDLYSHTLRLTETGLREEIVIKSKPAFVTDKANLWLVLDTVVTGVSFEDGWLDAFEIAQMHFPPPTATDAEGREGTAKRYAKTINGVQHIFTGLKFSELYRASYPVTIDPDFSVQPDPTAGKDTQLYSGAGASNYANGTSLSVGSGYSAQRRFMLQFDVSSIDSGATISSATASLYCNEVGNTNSQNIGFHRGLKTWVENQVSWRYQITSSVEWSGGANGGVAGTEFAETATDTTAVTTAAAWYDWDVATDIAAWIAGTATNYGWWGVGSPEDTTVRYKVFYTSDYTTDTTLRPKLVVSYTTTGGVPKHFLHYARLRSN